MDIQTIFPDLRDLLSELYPDEPSIRRVIADAGLVQQRINFSTQPLNIWQAIVNEAKNRDKIDALLTVALGEYQDNSRLQALYTLYRQQIQPTLAAYGDAQPTAPQAPFIGSAPFQTQHTQLFYGREQDIRELLEMLCVGNAPLLVVNGLSGVGKTSLLRAGLVPKLRAQHFSVAYTSILDSPESDVIKGIQNAFPGLGDKDYTDLPDTVNDLISPLNRPFVLMVDQVERCFTLTKDNVQRLNFWRGIARLIGDEVRCPTKVLLAVRSDWLYAFQDVGPTLSVSAYNFLYKLEPLDLLAARRALVGPLEQTGFAYEPELIDTILADLAVDGSKINPPQLQIVGAALYQHWQESERKTERRLTLADYQALHGARSIIRNHLLQCVTGLGPNLQAGWQILLQLVSTDGLRVSKRAEDLQGNLSWEQFESIVNHFVTNALVVREISTANNLPVYTLTHDYLIEEINHHISENLELQAWRTAEHFLSSGLADWREARKIGAELFLDHDRYAYIWHHKDVFGPLNEEANHFLTQTALLHGEPSFSFWLKNQRAEQQPVLIQQIVAQVLADPVAARTAMPRALGQARTQQLLAENAAQLFKALFWAAFCTPPGSPPTSAAAAPALSDQSPPLIAAPARLAVPAEQRVVRQRRQMAALMLWALRPYLDYQQVARIAPSVLTVWLREHRTQLFSALGSALGVLLIVFATLTVRQALRGYWEPLPALWGGPIAAVAVAPTDPNAIYIVTQQGPNVGDGATLLRRQQPGEAWQVITQNFTQRPVRALTIVDTPKGRRLYASLQGGGIIRSIDEGASWQATNNGLLTFSIRTIVADPHNADLLYAASDQQRGVYESRDGGVNWQDISGPELFGISILAMTYTNHDGGALLVGTDDGRVLARPAGSAQWAPVITMPGVGNVITLAAEPIDGQTIYAGTSNGTLLVSQNGATPGWQPKGRLPDIFEITAAAVAPGEPTVVLINAVGIGGYVTWISRDSGQNWQLVADNTFTREPMTLLTHTMAPTRTLAIGSAGFFESADWGAIWTFDPHVGSPLANIGKLAISPVADGPTYASVGGAIFVTLDPLAGEWQRGRTLPARAVNDIVADQEIANRAYAAVFLSNRWSIFMTTDGGKSWQATLPPTDIDEGFFTFMQALEIGQHNGQSLLYAGSNHCGLVYSQDHGQSWQPFGHATCTFKEDEPKDIRDIAADPHVDGRLFVAADRNRVYRTTNGGASWSVAQLNITGDITVLKVDPQIPNRLYLIAGSNGFWRSDDSGVHWDPYSQGLEEKALVDFTILPDPQQALIVAAETGEVWRTQNGGKQWLSIKENLSATTVTALTYDVRSNRLLLGSSADGLQSFTFGSLRNLVR